MGRVAFYCRGIAVELFNEKASSHAMILSHSDRAHAGEKPQVQTADLSYIVHPGTFQPADQPKMSFTLSKSEEPRSAGLFSTFSDAPSCSINLRCSRVSLVGVSTRT